jgi:hypothetical protein
MGHSGLKNCTKSVGKPVHFAGQKVAAQKAPQKNWRPER